MYNFAQKNKMVLKTNFEQFIYRYKQTNTNKVVTNIKPRSCKKERGFIINNLFTFF